MIRFPFTQRCTLTRIPRTSDQMHNGYTSDINNERKIHAKSFMTIE